MSPLDAEGRTSDEAFVVTQLAAGPLTVHELLEWTGLSLRDALLALRGLLNRGDVVALDGARYALDEVTDDRQADAGEVRG